MPKELRISAVVLLPDDAFEQGSLMSAAQPIVATFTAALRKAVKQECAVEARVVNQVNRGKKVAEPAPSAALLAEAPEMDPAPEPEPREAASSDTDALPLPLRHRQQAA